MKKINRARELMCCLTQPTYRLKMAVISPMSVHMEQKGTPKRSSWDVKVNTIQKNGAVKNTSEYFEQNHQIKKQPSIPYIGLTNLVLIIGSHTNDHRNS